jgi:cell division protein FtsW
MTVIISATWFVQFFLAGLPIIWVALLVGGGIAGVTGAYFSWPMCASASTASSIRRRRPLPGRTLAGGVHEWRPDRPRPGEGTSRKRCLTPMPISSAVAGEEFGVLLCLLLVALFAFVVLRGMSRLMSEQNLFVLLATGGLLTAFGLQAFVNMASALHLVPTKGMTLRFISYGGSSLLSLALSMGMVLALTRRRAGLGDSP